jgi:hypothetical protein
MWDCLAFSGQPPEDGNEDLSSSSHFTSELEMLGVYPLTEQDRNFSPSETTRRGPRRLCV